MSPIICRDDLPETPDWRSEPRPDPFTKTPPTVFETAEDDTPHTRGEN